jgi:6-phospho-3-hexuloisomerase
VTQLPERASLGYFHEAYTEIMDRVKDSIDNVSEKEVSRFVELLVEERSHRILVLGVGRSGLVGRAFAMRLMHLGFSVFVMGETITPAIGKGDLVIAISGSGKTKLAITAAEISEEVGAKVVAITSFPDNQLGRMAHYVVRVRGRTIIAEERDYFTRQIAGIHEPLAPLGTIFEDACTIFLDSLIPELMHRLGLSEKQLKKRHATIE